MNNKVKTHYYLLVVKTNFQTYAHLPFHIFQAANKNYSKKSLQSQTLLGNILKGSIATWEVR